MRKCHEDAVYGEQDISFDRHAAVVGGFVCDVVAFPSAQPVVKACSAYASDICGLCGVDIMFVAV